jgi:hypothetical protein
MSHRFQTTQALRDALQRAVLTHSDVARRVGLQPSNFSNILCGSSFGHGTKLRLERLCSQLGMNARDVIVPFADPLGDPQ